MSDKKMWGVFYTGGNDKNKRVIVLTEVDEHAARTKAKQFLEPEDHIDEIREAAFAMGLEEDLTIQTVKNKTEAA